MTILSLATSLTLLIPFSSGVTNQNEPKKDLIDTATEAGTFKTLLAAVRAAGLEEVLRGKGPFTVFAPTDQAFAKLPAGTLETLLDPANRATLAAILEFHVVAGSVDAAKALDAGTARTLAGAVLKITLEEGRLRVQDANVVQNDIAASNGVIHVIDRILLPPKSAAASIIETSAASLIETAIRIGVPLFNDGQEAACAAVYEITSRSLLRADEVSAEFRGLVAKALRTAATESPADAAWTLRYALDAVLAGLPAAAPKAEGDTKKRDSQVSVFEFDDSAEAVRFRSLNDTVMGGRSNSRMASARNTGIFAGTVSLANNGGFASVRAPVPARSLVGTSGIAMRFRGDGRTYRFTLQEGQATWDLEFPTESGRWTEVRLPYEGFRRNIRGYRPNSNPPQPSNVTSIGILIGDKKAGDFQLEIDWIRAYS